MKINIHATNLVLVTIIKILDRTNVILSEVLQQGNILTPQARRLAVCVAKLAYCDGFLLGAMKADKAHLSFKEKTHPDWKLLDSLTTNIEVSDMKKYET